MVIASSHQSVRLYCGVYSMSRSTRSSSSRLPHVQRVKEHAERSRHAHTHTTKGKELA